MSTPNTNTGHGHVWARPDGVKARCGGPAICATCARDAARLDANSLAPQPPSASTCKYGDPACPCVDGDTCHYEGPNPMPPPAASEAPDGYTGSMLLSDKHSHSVTLTFDSREAAEAFQARLAGEDYIPGAAISPAASDLYTLADIDDLDVYEAYKTWPYDIRKKLSLHDLRRMNGWAPKLAPNSEWAAVPRFIHLSEEDADSITFFIGNKDDGFNDATLFVGIVTDDDGKYHYGLAIRSEDYPEEGAIMLHEFEQPAPPAGEPVAWHVIHEEGGSHIMLADSVDSRFRAALASAGRKVRPLIYGDEPQPDARDALSDYQQWVMDYWMHRRDLAQTDMDSMRHLFVMTVGLAGEAGEAVEIVKKWVRKGQRDPIDVDALRLELGDTLYYLARLAGQFGITLQSIVDANRAKLEARRARDVAAQQGGGTDA